MFHRQNWFFLLASFYHPGPIEGEEGGKLLFRYSLIYVNGLDSYI